MDTMRSTIGAPEGQHEDGFRYDFGMGTDSDHPQNGLELGYARVSTTRAQGADRVQSEIDRMGAGSPIGRIAQTGEIAKAVAFLACDDSSFIHGVELFADGGLAQV